jgi:hypothetical protein
LQLRTDDRYPNAAAMEQDLQRFLMAHYPRFNPAMLGELMAESFPEHLAGRAQDADVIPLSVNEERLILQGLPHLEGLLAPTTGVRTLAMDATEPKAAEVRPGKRRRLWYSIGAVFGLLLVAAFGWTLARFLEPAPSRAPSAQQAPPPPIAPTPPAQSAPESAVPPKASPSSDTVEITPPPPQITEAPRKAPSPTLPRDPCGTDRHRYCAGITNERAMVTCLRRNLARLSPHCTRSLAMDPSASAKPVGRLRILAGLCQLPGGCPADERPYRVVLQLEFERPNGWLAVAKVDTGKLGEVKLALTPGTYRVRAATSEPADGEVAATSQARTIRVPENGNATVKLDFKPK